MRNRGIKVKPEGGFPLQELVSMLALEEYFKNADFKHICFFCGINGKKKKFRFLVKRRFSVYACSDCIKSRNGPAQVLDYLEKLPSPSEAFYFSPLKTGAGAPSSPDITPAPAQVEGAKQ